MSYSINLHTGVYTNKEGSANQTYQEHEFHTPFGTTPSFHHLQNLGNKSSHCDCHLLIKDRTKYVLENTSLKR